MTVLGSDSFYVVRAVLVVDSVDNSSYEDWDNATQTLVSGANFQPFLINMADREFNKDRRFSESFYRVYAPPGTDVRYTDKILFNGKMHEISGEPNNWRKFSGDLHHVAFLVRLRQG